MWKMHSPPVKADDDSDNASRSASREGRRSRLSSFASDDSGGQSFAGFHSDAVHGLLDVLRGTSGSFNSEKLEFMSLRLANNASDAAMQRAVATAFVRRGVELMTPPATADSDGAAAPLDPAKAAKHVLTAREGAAAFVAEVGVGDTADRAEQVEFALALQKACAACARTPAADRARVGNLLAALLQQAYDLDIIEEEGILAWWADPRGKGGSGSGGSAGDEMAAVRQKCQALVEWLQEDDDDDDDDDSEEEDDD